MDWGAGPAVVEARAAPEVERNELDQDRPLLGREGQRLQRTGSVKGVQGRQ